MATERAGMGEGGSRRAAARLRRLVPRFVRHGISAQVARLQAARLANDLARLASGTDVIVAGPWLGEVGFELLYWVPFLRWFAETFAIAPDRLLVVSRGGTASWYRPFASGYREIFDDLTPEEFRQRHLERVATNGEQKQTRVLAFEHALLQQLTADVHNRAMLHPATMYQLFNPFWWGHVDEQWVHRHARFARLTAEPLPAASLPMADGSVDAARLATQSSTFVPPSPPYTAVKFYFNECFPATDANRAFVRRTLRDLALRGPVVSLATGLHLDDHGGDDAEAAGVQSLPPGVDPRINLALQTTIVANAAAFVGTYGGFSYLAPFLGVPATAYVSNPEGYSRRHLSMARSALGHIDGAGRLEVQQTGATPGARTK